MKHGFTMMFALAFISSGFVPRASGQNDRSWVSGTGSDSNGCSRSAPCKTFAHALAVTNASGEIDAIDPADYGPITIDRSITIDGGFGLATINGYVGVCNGNLLNVAICVGGQNVTLRNLSINGNSTSSNLPGNTWGIVGTGSVLHIENVVVVASYNVGITVVSGKADIKNTVVRDCTGDGIDLLSGTTAVLDNVEVSGSAGFFAIASSGNTTIRNSSVVRNNWGVITAAGTVTLDNVLVAFNKNVGVGTSSSPATMQLSNVTITGNGTGIVPIGPVISFVNNRIYGNTNNGAPTQSVYQK